MGVVGRILRRLRHPPPEPFDASIMPIEIAPALRPDEWQERSFAYVDQVGDETHVVVEDPDGEVVSVSGPDEVFSLMALANDALPDGDPRKLTHAKAQLLRDLTADMWRGHRAAEQREALVILAQTISALLPPST